MHTYNASKPEQKTVQVKDSSTKPSYWQKPLPHLPEREGISMSVTCYECGQAGYIWTNCPRLTKVRTGAVRADGTEDPEMDPQEEDLPPVKEGEGQNSEHQEEQLDVHMEPQYQWDTEEEEETDDNAVSYRTNAIRIALNTEEKATTKKMAA